MASKYVDTSASLQVIGCLYQKPTLLDDTNYAFQVGDFPDDMHRVVFSAISNLYHTGDGEHFSVQSINEYLRKFPNSYAIYDKNRGDEWVRNVAKFADMQSFVYNATRVKKMTLLRSYESVGVDVSFILDPTNVTDMSKKEKQEQAFDKLSIKSLVDIIENRVTRVKDDVVEYDDNYAFHAGDSSEQYLNEILNGSNNGYPLYDRVFSRVVGGAREGKLILRSASSGTGKALPNDTDIPTPDGWKKVGDVKEGDYLFDAFGKPTKVIGVFPQGKKEVWQITFGDGRKAKCSPDHLWSYITYDDLKINDHTRSFKTDTLRNIVEYVLKDYDKKIIGSYRVHNIYIPIASFEPDTEYGRFNPIEDIVDLDYQTEMTCFLVDNSEHLFLMNDFIVTHNTRTAIGDACYLACDEIYEDGQWQSIGEKIPTLYISVEQDPRELESLLLSFISGVSSSHIDRNEFDIGELDRVKKAIEIEKRSKLYCVFMPDYKLSDVKNAIAKGIREHGIRVCFFDYICSSISIMNEVATMAGGVKMSEYQILYMMASSLKDIAENFGITVITSSQLNGSARYDKTPDANALAGAKSMINRCDVGAIMMDVSPEDLNDINGLFNEQPNVKCCIFKNRSGEWNRIILWLKADKGICRYKTIGATTYMMEPIPLGDILPELKKKENVLA